MAATFSPTMQRSTIGDAVCVGGSAASLPPLRHAPLSRALAPSARLCRAPLRPPPPVPRASDAFFYHPHDHLSLMGYNSKVFPLVTSVFIIGLSLSIRCSLRSRLCLSLYKFLCYGLYLFAIFLYKFV